VVTKSFHHICTAEKVHAMAKFLILITS